MKRRQFLKMIPLGILSGLVPGFLRAEPEFYFETNGPTYIQNAKQAAELFGDGSQIARMIGETDLELKERVIYKLKDITYV